LSIEKKNAEKMNEYRSEIRRQKPQGTLGCHQLRTMTIENIKKKKLKVKYERTIEFLN